jgi:glycosyltransferase involved in cell wall biosynthesis
MQTDIIKALEIEGPILISVIIPVFDASSRLKVLSFALDALGNQSISRKQVEVILVDNSVNPSVEIARLAEKYHQRLQIKLIWEQIPGSYAARNSAVRAATGAVLAFMDSDCVPSPDWLFYGLKALNSGKVEDRVVAGRVIRRGRRARGTVFEWHERLFSLNQRMNVKSRSFCATANLFVKKSIFLKVGYFDSRLLSGGDLEWGARFKKIGGHFLYAPTAVVEHQVVDSLLSLVKRTRRKAGGRFLLEKLDCEVCPFISYSGFNVEHYVARLRKVLSPFSRLGRVLLLRKIILWIHDIEMFLCRLGKSPLRN